MIKIIAVGKIKEKFVKAQIAEYEKRLRPFTKLEKSHRKQIVKHKMHW